MKKSVLKKYAKLIIKKGVNLQKGQELTIYSACNQEAFTSMIVEEAYKAKCKKVTVRWTSDMTDKHSYKYADVETLGKIEDWELARLEHRCNTLPARLYIESSDPDAMNGVDQEKVAKAHAMSYKVIKPYLDRIENKEQWCIAAASSPEWAKKVFPDLPVKKAVEKLWEAIIYTSRVDNDPIKAWEEHNKNLADRCAYLNSLNLAELHYTASIGTDLTVGLIEDCLFEGGTERALGSNIEFNPNIPSEEVFTSPMKGKAEGIVYATKPLSYMGELIENFSVRFENGKAVEVKAEKNEALLKRMIAMDEAAPYLGECAFIPYDSPINNTNILFYNTLFDENASCHLALGMGFTNLIKNFDKYTLEELYAKGINDSMIHVDFMIGTKDLNIVGTTKDGKKVQIFKNGNWAF